MDDQELAALNAAADENVVHDETSEATENTDGQDTQPAEGDEPPKDKTKSQERRERRDAAERRSKDDADDARREAQSATERLKRVEASISGLKEPRENDFDDPLVYASAKAFWLAKREDRTEEAQQARADIQRASETERKVGGDRIAALARDFKETEPDARARYTDYDVVFNKAIIPQGLAELILEGDAPHDVAYHLGKNPDVNARILSMSPVQAARELGKIEASLAMPRAKTQSNAPSPINPTRGSATAPRTKDSFADYKAARESGWRPS